MMEMFQFAEPKEPCLSSKGLCPVARHAPDDPTQNEIGA
jgi:hypothetical protein